MKNFFIYSAVFMAMLLMVVYGDDTPIKPIPKECPKKDNKNYTVHIAHETNCSKFYVCQGGKKIPPKGLTCPKYNKEGDLLYFNPLLQVCDWPKNVECENKPDPDEGDGGEGGPAQLVRDNIVNRLLMNRV